MRRTAYVVGLVALLALACGPAAQPEAPAAPETDQPRSGGQLNQPVGNDPFDWDLTYNGKTQPMYHGQGLAYNSLVGFDRSPEVKYDEQVMRPEIAERWEVAPDGKTFTYYLRKGVKFANLPPVNGREITAQDVKWSFEYQSRTGQFKDVKLPPGTMAFMYDGLERVDVPDPYTAVVRLREPFVPFAIYAASRWNPIFPREVYEEDGHFKDRIIGSGPFQLDPAASQKGTRWVFKKNPDYWDAGKPYLDAVRWIVLPDTSTTHAAFRSRQIDWLDRGDLDLRSQQEVRNTVPDAVVAEYEYPAGGWLVMNNRSAPLDKVEVRKALVMAIDRDQISQTLFGKKQPWALAGSMNGLFTDEEAKRILKYDPAEAKRLLAQAGYPNGVEIEFQYRPQPGSISHSIHELLQAQWRQVGIKANLEAHTAATYAPNRRSNNYTLQFLTWACGGSLDDHDTTLNSCFHSTSPYNVHGVSDPALDKLLIQQRSETDPEKRRQIFRQAATLIAEKAYGGSLFYPLQWEAWQGYVKNYRPYAINRHSQPWWEVWLDK